jgi:hypothetical protein
MLKSLWWGTVEEKDNLEDLDVCGIMILKWNFNRMGGRGLD